MPKTVASNIEEAEKRRTVNTYSVAVASVLWDSGMSKDDVHAILDSHGKEVTDDGLRIAAGQLLWNNGDKAKALKTLEEYSDLDGYKDAANILRTGDVAAVEKKGTLAEVEVPEDDVMLDEQKTLDKQPETVREALSKLAITGLL